MKKTLLCAAAIALASAASAQCTPNQLYADSVYGVWPDTLEGFANGILNTFYSDTLNLLVPQEAGLIDPNFDGFVIDSVALDAITGLPPGLAVACNSQTGAACSFLTSQVGCGLIEGIPTAEGTYEITLDVTAYTTLGIFVLPVPQSFSGYRITITADNTSITPVAALASGKVRNNPNPFADRTNIEFSLSQAGKASITVYNMVGVEVWNKQIAAKQGLNQVVFNGSALESGAYLYKITSGGHTATGRMIVDR